MVSGAGGGGGAKGSQDAVGLQAEKSSGEGPLSLMAGGHTGFHQERLITGYARQRKLRARGPEQEGARASPLERVTWLEGRVCREGQEVRMRGQKRPFRRPTNPGY